MNAKTNDKTMTLKEFLDEEGKDGNIFWRLSCGDHQNLLDEAIEQISDKDKRIDALEIIISDVRENYRIMYLQDAGHFKQISDLKAEIERLKEK